MARTRMDDGASIPKTRKREILRRRHLRLGAWALLAASPALLGACQDDNGMNPQMEETTFEVRIENVSQAYAFTSSGAFAIPAGSDAPGPLPSGQSYEFEFHAGPGSRVSFATMFVQSNDLFYGPDGEGIRVFDMDGMPISGDITDQIYLWDAGTEANQEPGVGADQAPRQAGANSGAADPDNTVRKDMNTFGNLPAVDEILRVTLTHLGGTEFRIRVANVAAEDALPVSTGGFAPVLLAPGVWTVGGEMDALFTEGQADRGLGLEGLAEDGDFMGLESEVGARTGLTSPIAPGVYAVHTGSSVLFAAGGPDRGEGLEALAEDGDPSGLATAVAGRPGVQESGAFTIPEGAANPAPAFPGEAYVFTVTAMPGDRLSLATMLVQSNDLFYAPAEAGIALFNGGGAPESGDITGMFLLWDAGTETNEFPGVGPNQAPRQSGADTGGLEGGNVRQVNDGYTYPGVDRVIRIILTPMASGS